MDSQKNYSHQILRYMPVLLIQILSDISYTNSTKVFRNNINKILKKRTLISSKADDSFF